MLFTSIIVAVFGLTALGRSHMKMSNPVPFGKSSLDTSPLADDGSDFPCKNRTGVYDPEGANNIMPLGSVQPLEFIGIAVHAGGSCQVSITYDLQPTNLSVFKVIHSIEGGCPAQNTTGNLDSEGGTATSPDPFTYSFMVPSSIPTGNATIAWTWFNKDGNREMYMNCAPVDITAAASSNRSGEDHLVRMKRDQAAFNALPNMFVGNIDGGGASGGYPHCGTTANTSLIFPDPGGSVDQFNTNELSVRVGPTGQCTVSGTLTNYGSVGVQQTALRSNDSPSTSAAITVGTAPSVPIVGSTSAAPVSTSPPNIVSDTELGCTKNYTVQAGDTCASIANANSITVAQFLEWNSLINPGCTNIQLNTAYCIAGTDSGGTAATSAQNTATSTSSTIPGAATGCNKWYRVQPGDTCASIANANSITTEQILAWNSKINPGCTNILLNGTYCIAGTNSGGTNNAGTTAQATSALNTAIGVASTATTSPSSYATTVTSSEPVTASATEAPVVIVTVYKTVNPTNSATSAPDTTSTIISTTSSTISTSTGLSLANSASAVLGGGQESSSNSTPVGTGSETVQTGTCTANGNWNCIGGSRYQRCASGSWSTLQPVADGTACQPGQGQDLVYVANPAQPNREYNPPDLPDPYKHIPTPTPTPTLPPPPPTSTPASPLSPPSGSGSFLADTACTIEGQWNCIEGSSFQQCGSGFWSTTQSVAPGTICQPVGQSKDFTIKPAKPKRQTGLYNEGQSGTHKSAPNSKQTGSCPPAQEGLWNCIGGSSFQQCASGAWSDPQFVASGTTCQPVGLSSDLVVSLVTQPTKRAIRFSGEHLRMREAF